MLKGILAAAIFAFTVIWTTVSYAELCDNVYIVSPPVNAKGVQDGGVFYLYENINPNTKLFPPKGYLPYGTLVWNKKNPIFNEKKRNIQEPKLGKVPHIYFISEFGEFGYIRKKFVEPISDFVNGAGLSFKCSEAFKLVIPIGADDEDKVLLYNIDGAPKPTDNFTRSLPTVVVHLGVKVKKEYKIDAEPVINTFLEVFYRQPLKDGGFKITKAYLRGGDEGRTYRLTPVARQTVSRVKEGTTLLKTVWNVITWSDEDCHRMFILKDGVNVNLGFVSFAFSSPDPKVQKNFSLYIRKMARDISNLVGDSDKIYRVIACVKIADKSVDHFLSSVRFSLKAGGKTFDFELPVNLLNKHLGKQFKKIQEPIGAGAKKTSIPAVGMFAFKGSVNDYYYRYWLVERWLSGKIDEVTKFQSDDKTRLIRFLLPQIIYAPSKK